jgi:hypothetical protein
MDSRDTQEFYEKREVRKAERAMRKRQYETDTKNAIATVVSLGLIFLMTIVMISQLVSCATPPNLDAYEQHKADVVMYRNLETLKGTPHNELQAMWGTMYIEARLNN